MSPDGELLFAPSDNLLMSDFSSLTELDDFHKDLFLSNAMDGMEDGGLLELDCKDDLKLISDVNDTFNSPLQSRNGDMGPGKAQDHQFTMFMDEETSESLKFMDMAAQLDPPLAVSDSADIKSMSQTHTIIDGTLPPKSSEQIGLHMALLAADELNCMSLDELDLTSVNHTNAMCSTLSPPHLNQAVLSSSTSIAEFTTPLPPLSPLEKAVSMSKIEAQALYSADMVTPPIHIISPRSPPSSTVAFIKDGRSLFNSVFSGSEGCLIPHLSTLAQPISVTGKEDNSVYSMAFGSRHAIQGQVPSMQRSQSSHALGQLRMSHCLCSHADDTNVKLMCKQELPPSSAPCTSILTLYQSPNHPQGLSARSVGVPMRRVCSAGDLQGFNGMQNPHGIKTENPIPEEVVGVKIGHCTIEERKMKLHRYRQKRTERNFSKKIKYACRKTLADNRPRVRGRFARSDETGESSLVGNDLPLIDEYEEVTSRHHRMVRDQQAFLMANSSCIKLSNPIAQFWNTVGMKVAM